MKLRISQQQDDERPTSLTHAFFINLMATESKRNGIFQILAFNRKRERVFSTKLNDGYFKLKVMIVSQAAEQLEKGLIKPYYLLEGSIKNHGEGAIIIKDPMKFWQYGKEIGQPVPWKLKRENVNFRGSNLVIWSTQKIQKLHGNASQIMADYGIQTSPEERKINQKTDLKYLTTAEKHDFLDQIFASDLKPHQSNQEQATKSIIDEKIYTADTQTISNLDQNQKLATPKNQNKEKRFRNILELLATDNSSDQENQIIVCPKLPSQKKVSTNKKKIEERRKDLQFIFNCLADTQSENEQNQPSKVKNTNQFESSLKLKNDQVEDQDIIEWIQRKKSQQNKTQSPVIDKEVSKNDKNKKLIAAQSKEATPKKELVTLDNLYHGYRKKGAMWYCEAVIKCMQTDGDIIHAIICDTSHHYLMSTTFFNISGLSFSLQQNRCYKLGNGLLRQSMMHRLSLSSIDIQIDCKTCIIQQKDTLVADIIQPSQNYTPVGKLYSIEEGIIINCFGILKDFKSFKGKTGITLHYEIVDPITRWSITYVQFESRLSPESIRGLIDKPVTIYGAMTSSYKNKVNLVRKPFTILRHEWLPLTKEAREVGKWAQECNSAAHIQTELVGYNEVNELRDVEDETGTNFFIRNVQIIEFKSKYSYRACSSCFKKVEENRCRNCGFRKPAEIVDRLFLRGELGDYSATMNVIWANTLAEMLMSNGFEVMKKQWLLRSVSVWIDKSNNNTISIVKMKVLNCNEDIGDLLKTINKSLLRN